MSIRLTVNGGPPAGTVIQDAEALGLAVIAARFHRSATTYVLADEPPQEAVAELCERADFDTVTVEQNA